MNQNKLYKSKEEAKLGPKGEIFLVICNNCGFIFNKKFDFSADLYDKEYNNDQSAAQEITNYVEETIKIITDKFIKPESSVLEIGCGHNATFLKQLIFHAPFSCKGVGYDPSYEGAAYIAKDNEQNVVQTLQIIN